MAQANYFFIPQATDCLTESLTLLNMRNQLLLKDARDRTFWKIVLIINKRLQSQGIDYQHRNLHLGIIYIQK